MPQLRKRRAAAQLGAAARWKPQQGASEGGGSADLVEATARPVAALGAELPPRASQKRARLALPLDAPSQRAQAERCGACSLLPPPPVSAGHGRVRRAQARRCATSSLTPSALPQCCPCLRAFPRRRSGSWGATRAYSWRCGCARRSHSRCTRRTCAAQSCGPLRCACPRPGARGVGRPATVNQREGPA